MLRKNDSHFVWYEFELLQKYPVKHAVFTRKGGVSKAPFDSLNVGDNVGDDPEDVRENKSRIAEKFSVNHLQFLTQVHGNDVEQITKKDDALSADGMVTTQKGLALAIRHADCQAAIFYDRKNHVLANVHAGWRGNVQHIYHRTLEKMKQITDTKPEDVIACISPSLGPTFAEFVNYKTEFPESFWKYQDENNHFNLWKIAKDELLELNIPEEQIEIASICTYINEGDFFSFRRVRETGRNATLCSLA